MSERRERYLFTFFVVSEMAAVVGHPPSVTIVLW